MAVLFCSRCGGYLGILDEVLGRHRTTGTCFRHHAAQIAGLLGAVDELREEIAGLRSRAVEDEANMEEVGAALAQHEEESNG